MNIHAIDEKSGLSVVEVLRSKHPPESIPDDLDDLGEAPPLPAVDISQEIVERVAKTMGELLVQGELMPPNFSCG